MSTSKSSWLDSYRLQITDNIEARAQWHVPENERNDEDMEDGTDYGSESEREHQICMLVREMEEQAQKERERKEQERLAKLDPVVELEKKIREKLRSR
ncbi:hypothetical protein L13192_05920 [Pyrenophora tritici-repentis]|nr:hypothetical protein Alg215_04141 [Pyrenophora tritici-repentis]KAI1670404.1 hypothetical protein L13192_05920 [Pyrenophora tritici-repentis]KAI1682026.1 hypothetical protein KJE20_08897 [Pyrenophora tritici-repentis]